MTTEWWKDAVFYQIYPRSFMDSNGDGIGDLRGIAERLDYLQDLGVDALWLSPFYPSPMKDFGYDISDYCGVDPRFGTLDDFKSLRSAAAGRGIRIVVDLVVNHCSDQHPWFVSARASKDAPEHDLFLWRPMERGFLGRKRRPNNWIAQFELSSAWWENRATDEWYLGTFTRNQPEFDFRNPELRRRIFEVMRFWLDLGVDGFRLDVANWYVKDEAFRSNPPSAKLFPDLLQKHVYDRNRPESHEVCREMRKVSSSYPGDRVLIGEIYADDPAIAASYHGASGDELDMAFNFDFLFRRWNAAEFRSSAERWYAELGDRAWPNFTLSNHDNHRHSYRYRGGTPAETDARERVAAAMLLTLRGTPFLYYGEEIGMEQSRLSRAVLRDPLGVKTWPLDFGRDGERTPMQWDAGPNGGFSDATPWLPVHPDAASRNVAAQRAESGSLLNWYRALLSLRKVIPALRRGEIEFVGSGDDGILAYVRRSEGGQVLVALDFSGKGGAVLAGAEEEPASRVAAQGAVGDGTALSPASGWLGSVLLGSRRGKGERLDSRNGALVLGPYEVLIAGLD